MPTFGRSVVNGGKEPSINTQHSRQYSNETFSLSSRKFFHTFNVHWAEIGNEMEKTWLEISNNSCYLFTFVLDLCLSHLTSEFLCSKKKIYISFI